MFRSALRSSAGMVLLGLGLLTSCNRTHSSRWELNRLENIGGFHTQVLGQPKLVESGEGGTALEFDGIGDGLLVEANPIAGAEAFSIEVLFKPYAGFPQNREQRFLHLQDPENDKRRLLMELRLNSRGEWYPDLFMRTDSAALTLMDSTRTYPVGKWYKFKLHYQQGRLSGYVNDEQVLQGEIHYGPIGPNAHTSLGVRMNQVSWFKGAIQSVAWQWL